MGERVMERVAPLFYGLTIEASQLSLYDKQLQKPANSIEIWARFAFSKNSVEAR